MQPTLITDLYSPSLNPLDVEKTLEHWWTLLLPESPTKPNWLCLATQQISPLARERWLSSPLSAWHSGFKGLNALLFYSINYETRFIQIHGMVSLAPFQTSNKRTIGDLLITDRCHLVPENREILDDSLLNVPPLLYPTLQTTHQKFKSTLCDLKILDADNDEKQLLTQCISIMVSLAKLIHSGGGRNHAVGPDLTHAVLKLIPASLGQLELAKLRFYLHLSLVGFSCDPGSPILDLGLQCFQLLTEAAVARHCPTEKHVARAITDFDLPFEPSCSLGARNHIILPQIPAQRGVMPCFLPLHLPESRMAAIRLYSEHKMCNQNARTLLLPGLITSAPAVPMFGTDASAGAVKIMIRPPMTDLGSTPGLLLDPELPCSFHCLLSLNIVSSNRTGLLQRLIWFVENELLLTVPDRLVVVHEPVPSHDAVFFSVQELLFANTKQLSEFRDQWAARFSLATVSAPYLSPSFLPHVPAHLYASVTTLGLPLAQLLTKSNLNGRRKQLERRAVSLGASSHREIPSVTWFFKVDAQSTPLMWPLFATWVADNVVHNIRTQHSTLHTEKQYKRDPRLYFRKVGSPGMSALFAQLWLPLCVRLLTELTNSYARQQEVVAQLTSSLSSSSSSVSASTTTRTSAASYAEAARLEATIASSNSLLEQFFRDINAGVPVVLEPGGNSLRAGKLRELMFTIQGQYKMHWHNFTDMGRKIHGVGLLSLVRQVMACTDSAAIQHMHKWVIEHNLVLMTPQADGLENPPASASSQVQPPRRDMNQAKLELAQWLARIGRLSVGCVGQRYLRETRGLKDAPIPLIETNPCLRYSDRLFATEDCRLPALVCLTVHQIAAQRIYLDPMTLDKNKDLEASKKHKGSPLLPSGHKDSVRVQFQSSRWPCTAFICEGVETALSVAYALPDATVHAALGIGNIKDFEPEAGTRCVVWCRENDPPPDTAEGRAAVEQRTRRIRRTLTTRFEFVHEVYPPSKYNDFNDIHIEHAGEAGCRIIRTCFDSIIKKLI